jgi:hypothetical protein
MMKSISMILNTYCLLSMIWMQDFYCENIFPALDDIVQNPYLLEEHAIQSRQVLSWMEHRPTHGPDTCDWNL